MDGLEPANSEMAGLYIERRGVCERLRRCDDLFGKMLLTGKLKSLDRQISALRSAAALARGEGS